MGAVYDIPFSAVAVAAQQDFFELTAAASRTVKIRYVRLSQHSSVTSEMLSLALKRGTSGTTSGSGGTTGTAGKVSKTGGAFGSTVELNNTTRMAVGTGVIETLPVDAFNVLNGWTWDRRNDPLGQIEISPGERFTVELTKTPSATLTMNGVLEVEETGGT